MSAVFDLTCDLIARRSVTPDDAGCQQVLAERLQAAGFTVEHLRFGDVDNLWATHGSEGPVLVFLGHTDVVPSGPIEQWTSDPFVPAVRDGVLYGRGAADMKSGVAAMCLALEAFVRAHPQHPGTVALLVTSDEEAVALDGVRKVASLLQQRGQRIDWCITGEPSSKTRLGDLLRVGRRGSLSATLTVRGIQGHVAYPEKLRNPIHELLPALHALTARCWDEGYDSFPPTSFQVTDIHAGTGANNVIPGELHALFNIRYNPHWTAARLQEACEDALRQHGVDYRIVWHSSGEPFYTPEGRLRQVCREVLTDLNGEPPEESTGGGTSDARFIAPLGAHCVEIGPVNASIHKIDECIRVDELNALPGLYKRLLERLLLD